MVRVISLIIFLVIVSGIYFGLNYFVYKSLVRFLEIAPPWLRAVKWFFWFSGLSFFLNILLGRIFKVYIFNFYAYTWLGTITIAGFVCLLCWLPVAFSLTRPKVIGILALTVIAGISVVSLYHGLQRPTVRRLIIPLKNLPSQLSGFTIVQLSDLHLETTHSKKRLAEVIEEVIAVKPDLVVITGDLIDGNICEDPSFCEQLRRLNPPHGVLAITGNHEFYAGIDIFTELAKRSNIKVLRNESVTVAGALQIIGQDDDAAPRPDRKGMPFLDIALKNCNQQGPIILLYHRPFNFKKAAAKGVGLQLSGHTHAGQIPPMDLLVWVIYQYPFGLFQNKGSFLYTSCGTGYWGPAMRFLSRNEIVHITLVTQTAPDNL